MSEAQVPIELIKLVLLVILIGAVFCAVSELKEIKETVDRFKGQGVPVDTRSAIRNEMILRAIR